MLPNCLVRTEIPPTDRSLSRPARVLPDATSPLSHPSISHPLPSTLPSCSAGCRLNPGLGGGCREGGQTWHWPLLAPQLPPHPAVPAPGRGSTVEDVRAGADTTALVSQAGEGTDCLHPCSHPLKGCSCLCSAAERDLGFFPQCDPLGVLVLTSFPMDVLEELLLILLFSLNSFGFPFLKPVDDCFAPAPHCKPVATPCPFREQLPWLLLCPRPAPVLYSSFLECSSPRALLSRAGWVQNRLHFLRFRLFCLALL